MPGRPRLLAPLVAAVALVLVVLGVASSLYTDLLWFRSVDYSGVFTTVLRTQVLLFVIFGLAMAILVGSNVYIAYRSRPPFRPLSLEQQSLERYRVAVEPFLTLALLGISGLFGIFAGISASSRWESWLLWRNATSFGVRDEQFNRDISYFAFTYPFYRFVLGFLFTAIVLSLLAAAATHYLFGGLRVQTEGEKISAAARAHLSVLLGVFVLLKAVAYWLDRYGLAFSPRGRVQGASYTDINAVLPAKTMLLFIAVICAGLFFANVVFRNFVLPAIALGLLVVASVVIGGIYPFIVQQFQVKPNEPQREARYIDRNIKATRLAYGLQGNIDTISYPAQTDATPAELRADTATVPNTRLLDPSVLSPTFRQLQQIRGYYGFNKSLDIDRYDLGDGVKDYVVGVREVNVAGLADNQRSWVNERLAYTHGNGFVAAPANTTDPAGRPVFKVFDIPPTVATGLNLRITQPRIYFGEQSPSYSVVNTRQGEIDGPAGGAEDRQETIRYDGRGGVQLNGFLRKAMYALKFRERNLLLSGSITPDSRIQYIRDPRERVQKVAPFLTMDRDPYPAVVDGRILWILDGYTTSAGYPYSQPRQLGQATTDALTATGRTGSGAAIQRDVNYIRNSVKATVDAYDGTVSLYTWDDADPVLRTWSKAFPGAMKPRAEMSAELIEHVRYPEDLFKVQRDLLAQYHVTEPAGFFSLEDFWALPQDPADYNNDGKADDSGLQPPYYQLLQPPGTTGPSFNITTSFVARNRPNLAAFVTVSGDDGPDYGRMRVYELPSNSQIDGPGTVGGNFESNSDVSTTLSLLRSGGSQVITGNLLTLPVGGGLLYVQPVYVQASGGQSFPVLRKVIAGYGDRVSFTDTLQQSLDQLFGRGAVTAPPSGTPTPTPTGTPTAPSPGGTPPPPPPPAGDSLSQAIADADQAYRDGLDALSRQDFAAYGEAQRRLQEALNRAKQLSGVPDPVPTPAPAPTPTPTG